MKITNRNDQKEEQKNKAPTHAGPKVFLSCLPKTLAKESIMEYFSKYGAIVDLEFEYQKENSQSQGPTLINGILECSDDATRERILETKRHIIGKHSIKAKKHLTKQQLKDLYEMTRKRRIYIKKLPESFDNKDFRKLLESYGEVEQAYCVYGCKKRRKGFKYGYAIFKDQNSLKNLPSRGIPFNGELIEWTSYGKKQEEKRQESEVSVKSKLGKSDFPPLKLLENLSAGKNFITPCSFQKKRKASFLDNDSAKCHFFKPGEVLYHSMDLGRKSQQLPRNVRFNLQTQSSQAYGSKAGNGLTSTTSYREIRLKGDNDSLYHLF